MSSSRGIPRPSASSRAMAVLRAAAALTPKPWETGSGLSLRIFASYPRSLRIFRATLSVTSAFCLLPFTITSSEGRESSRTRATVRTPRLRQRPAPRDPFLRGSGSSTTSKKAVTCPGQNASPWDTMQDRAPDALGREGLRPLERRRVPLAVEDRDRSGVGLHPRHVVGDDQVEVRLLEEGHRLRPELRGAHARLGLEAHEALPRALARAPQAPPGG